MSLKAIRKLKKDKSAEILTVDLSQWSDDEEPVIARFRAPKVADIYPDSKSLQKIRIAYPECPEDLLVHVYTMGKCYIVTQEDDGEEEPWRAWVDLAKSNMEAFFYLATQWISYIGTINQEELKNASAE